LIIGLAILVLEPLILYYNYKLLFLIINLRSYFE